jgi:hypothetical protein
MTKMGMRVHPDCHRDLLRVQSSDDKSELFSFKALRIVPIAIGIHLA